MWQWFEHCSLFGVNDNNTLLAGGIYVFLHGKKNAKHAQEDANISNLPHRPAT